MARLIDMEAVIQHFGSLAVTNYMHWDKARDENALDAIESTNLANRHETIRGWLDGYRVLMGFTAKQRNDVTRAVLTWADARHPGRRLDDVTALSDAHREMTKACADAFGNKRDFTSLASKALWLCYPDDVPIFDSIAQRALCVISKLDGDIPPPSDSGESRYTSFIRPWKALYERYSAALQAVDMESCKRPVRIFDGILLCIGANAY